MNLHQLFSDPHAARDLLMTVRRQGEQLVRPVTLMEVCGSHTMAIAQHGLRSLLPASVRLVSGPGCPVCVTAVDYLDRAVALSRRRDVIITTFGDMLRVPGSSSSLQREQAAGADVRLVYSSLDALEIARRHPDKQVVFLAIGFETTAPTTAATLLAAAAEARKNFFVLCGHKTMPLAMNGLSRDPQVALDGYLCPAHVAAIIGAEGFDELAQTFAIPCVVTGFERLDLVQGLAMLLQQIIDGRCEVEVQYRRFVRPGGNRKAQQLLAQVFEPCDSHWRGLGEIAGSGLQLRPPFQAFDAGRQLVVELEPPRHEPGCRCGAVLRGVLPPQDCELFGRRCTPQTPVGACMVSSEGACAASYRFGG